jgi:hypothetical protein
LIFDIGWTKEFQSIDCAFRIESCVTIEASAHLRKMTENPSTSPAAVQHEFGKLVIWQKNYAIAPKR